MFFATSNFPQWSEEIVGCLKIHTWFIASPVASVKMYQNFVPFESDIWLFDGVWNGGWLLLHTLAPLVGSSHLEQRKTISEFVN